jgi:CheY-like chemotaxis protein
MSPSHHQATLLVVDDEEDVRSLLTMILEETGLRVLSAPDASTAVNLVRTEPSIGLALLDVRMPGSDGPRILALLRRIRPGLRCCFLTGDATPYGVPGLLAMGAEAVFGKPFELPDLVQDVRRLLGCGER